MASLTILIADDDASSLELIAMFLESNGHRVHTAPDGLEAWRLAQELKPDILLLDANMPGLAGADVAQRVRDAPELHECHLIALTGHDVRDAQQKHLFDQYFTKPVSPGTLLAALQIAGAGPRQPA